MPPTRARQSGPPCASADSRGRRTSPAPTAPPLPVAWLLRLLAWLLRLRPGVVRPPGGARRRGPDPTRRRARAPVGRGRVLPPRRGGRRLPVCGSPRPALLRVGRTVHRTPWPATRIPPPHAGFRRSASHVRAPRRLVGPPVGHAGRPDPPARSTAARAPCRHHLVSAGNERHRRRVRACPHSEGA